jgi:small subunit ribosomal protein S14
MLSLKIKDFKNRNSFFKKEKLNKIIKFLFINQLNNKNSLLKKYKLFFSKIKRKNSKTKLVNRCILNNRSRGSLRKFGVNRILLRDLFLFGIIPGYKKAVW